MNDEDLTMLVKWAHVGLRAAVVVYTAILFAWSHLSLVGTLGQGLFHISFWLALEIVYVVTCAMSIGFGLQTLYGNFAVDIQRNLSLSTFCMLLSVLIGGKNITHMVFVAMEINDNVEDYWFVVMLLIFLILLIILNFCMLLLFKRYKNILSLLKESRTIKKSV